MKFWGLFGDIVVEMRLAIYFSCFKTKDSREINWKPSKVPKPDSYSLSSYQYKFLSVVCIVSGFDQLINWKLYNIDCCEWNCGVYIPRIFPFRIGYFRLSNQDSAEWSSFWLWTRITFPRCNNFFSPNFLDRIMNKLEDKKDQMIPWREVYRPSIANC